MDKHEIDRLAAAVHALRPDWPLRSVVTFIAREIGTYAYQDAAVMLTWVATDPDTKTPRRVTENGPWRHAIVDRRTVQPVTSPECVDHPGQRASTCTDCHADAVPPPTDLRDRIKAEQEAARQQREQNRKDAIQ